jgi:GT2 family glycosyltransferase
VVSRLNGGLPWTAHFSPSADRDAFSDPRTSTSEGTRITDGRHRQFELSSGNHSPDFWRELAKETLDTYSVRIPFFARHDVPVSALGVYPAVKRLKKIALTKGWRLRQAVDFTEFGLHPDDYRFEFDTILEKGEKGLSSLSVVSPIYNREVELPSFLNSVMNQDFDERFELILVDDKSTDRSIRAIVRTLPDFPARIHVRLLRTKRKNRYEKGTFSFGAGLAREIAVRQSVGKRILFLDPDQIVEQGCLKEHATWGGRGFEVVIGDRLETDSDVSSQWQFLRTESLTAVADWWLSFFTGNSSVDRDLLLRVGGFDPRLQYWGLDDTDLGYRLWKEGASVWHTRRARVLHIDPLGSGGGTDSVERTNSYRLHMEVLYRKYLEEEILSAFSFVWADRVRSKSELT